MTTDDPRPAVPPARAPRAAGTVYAAARIFDLSLGEMLWSRRTIFMGLVVGLPVLIAFVLRLLVMVGVALEPIARGQVTGPMVFGLMIWGFFVRFSIPVLAVFYGTSLIADEVDDKTITYLFTRPIPRGAVLFGKYLAYMACTACVVLPAVMLVWVLIVPLGGSLGQGFLDLLQDLGVLAAGLAVYGAVFALAGTILRRPLVFGLVFVFLWENLALALPGDLKHLTVAFYLQALVPQAMPADSALSFVQTLFRETPGATESLLSMAIIAAVCLGLAARAVARREYVLEQ